MKSKNEIECEYDDLPVDCNNYDIYINKTYHTKLNKKDRNYPGLTTIPDYSNDKTCEEFLEKLKKPLNYTKLELNPYNCGFQEIPKQIACFKNLNELNIDIENMDKIPAEIYNLKKLTKLNFYFYEYKYYFFSEPFDNYNPNITMPIQNISNRICRLKKLNELSFHYMFIKKIPEGIGKLKDLIYLDLSFNKLKELPKAIGLLSKLKELYIDNNELNYLPSFMWKFKYLEYLDISKNKLNSIPKNIGLLHNLKYLYLLGNNFNYLPIDVCNLKNLEYLDLGIVLIGQKIENIEEIKKCLEPQGTSIF